ncbi:hypothetical protein HA402_011575 [Bradysia odoriphaga]|nr:hypothetical protein HA402_011575 [Bradysia odoriphaga]
MPPKLQSTSISTNTETKTKPDGTIIKTITTTTTEKYSDGSTKQKINVKTQTTTGCKKTNSQGKTTVNNTLPEPSKSSAPKAEITTPNHFIQLCLREHNKYRAKHHAPALTLNRELCKIAQSWANINAKENRMYHSTIGYGENLYYCTEEVKGDHPAHRWYSEIKDYDWKKNEPQKGTGHFTQVIWKGSKEIGIAAARSKSGNFYVVAEYYPPGNYVGEYNENVLKEN